MINTIVAGLFLTVSAAAAAQLPAGWVQKADGELSHKESGAICPAKLGVYALKGLQAGPDKNTLGICAYEHPKGPTGQIRVRRYVKGVGDTPMAITNDRGLMEPSGEHEMIAAVRMTPLPEQDGEMQLAHVITITVNKLLIDCIAVRPADEKIEIAEPIHDQCTKIQGF